MKVAILIALQFAFTALAIRFSGEHKWHDRPNIRSTPLALNHDTINFTWEVPKNTGFHYTTEFEYCKRLQTSFVGSYALFPMVGDKAELEEQFLTDSHWTGC